MFAFPRQLLATGALLLAAPVALVSQTAGAQTAAGSPRAITPADISAWKSLRGASLSNDGAWFAYVVAPNEGDADVVIRETRSGGKVLRFPIGEAPAAAGGPGGGGTVTGPRPPRSARLLEAMFLELLPQGVAVDAEAGGGLELYPATGGEHLRDQFPLHAADDAVEEVVVVRGRRGHALLDQGALDLLARAVPLTEIPSTLQNKAFAIRIAIAFRLPVAPSA